MLSILSVFVLRSAEDGREERKTSGPGRPLLFWAVPLCSEAYRPHEAKQNNVNKENST